MYFLRIMAGITIIAVTIGFATPYIKNTNNIFLITIFGLFATIFNAWSQTTVYYSIFNLNNKREGVSKVWPTLSVEKEVYLLGYKNAWKYFVVSFFFGLIMFFGIVLLIIPGIIFYVWYGFCIFIALENNTTAIESLKQSKLLVKGKFFPVLGRSSLIVLVLFVTYVSISFVPYIGGLLVSLLAPLFLLPMYLLYRDLTTVN